MARKSNAPLMDRPFQGFLMLCFLGNYTLLYAHPIKTCALTVSFNKVPSITIYTFNPFQTNDFFHKATVLPAKSDSNAMFCLQSYWGLRLDR